MLRFFLILLISLGLYSCRSVGSDTNVVGGISAERFTNVVFIYKIKYDDSDNSEVFLGYCSAMVVSDSTVITAAHCIDDPEIVSVVIKIGKYTHYTPRFKKHPTYNIASNSTTTRYDIGVVVFGKDTFRGFDKVKISKSLPVVGQTIRMVGYGEYTTKFKKSILTGKVEIEFDPAKPTTKRTGTNKISKRMYCSEGMIEVQVGSPTTDKQLEEESKIEFDNVAISRGDSGSPLLIDNTNEVLGVAVTQNIESGVQYNCFSSLTFQPNLEFLKQMVKDPRIQADIPGIEEIKPAHISKFDI